jgi:dienelactone hydrolase
MNMRKWLLSLVFLLSVSPLFAKVVTQTVEYKDGDQALEGYLVYDDASADKRPGVLVFHAWDGIGEHVKDSAKKLAKLGYVAFVADVYGKGVHPSNPAEFKAQAGKYFADRKLMRSRAKAAMDTLSQDPRVDSSKIAAIGYCFGGAVSLELGRSGAPLAAIATFHGSLANPTPADDANIKAKVLILQGGDDKFTLSDVPAMEKSFKDNNVDYKLVVYPGAVHGFTEPMNKGDMPGLKYDAKADKASWKEMKELFAKVFRS